MPGATARPSAWSRTWPTCGPWSARPPTGAPTTSSGGALSALDGIGPDDLNIPALVSRVRAGGVTEVIFATSATVDGQTTAHYIADSLEGAGLTITGLALGVPMGGELDYLDEGTLSAAMKARRPV